MSSVGFLGTEFLTHFFNYWKFADKTFDNAAIFSSFCDFWQVDNVRFSFSSRSLGEKKIVKLLHFPNITPTEQRRLLMTESDSGSGSDDEQEQSSTMVHEGMPNHKPSRKKPSTKRSLDMQRKISLSKLRDEKEKESNYLNNNSQSSQESTPSPSITSHSVPAKQKSHHRLTGARNGKISDGYDEYLKQYLLQVPMPKDYCEPSSDDLSSEWDSDVPENKNNEANNKESKVRYCRLSGWNLTKLCLHFVVAWKHKEFKSSVMNSRPFVTVSS